MLTVVRMKECGNKINHMDKENGLMATDQLKKETGKMAN